jgi:hypothetical protein
MNDVAGAYRCTFVSSTRRLVTVAEKQLNRAE